VSDLLKQFLDDATARLTELQPLVAEHERLTQVLASIDVTGAPVSKQPTASVETPKSGKAVASKPAPAAPAKSRARAKASPRRRPRVSAELRRRQLAELIEHKPGLTVAQLASELAMNSSGLYAMLNELRDQGALVKRDRRWFASSNGAANGDSPVDGRELVTA